MPQIRRAIQNITRNSEGTEDLLQETLAAAYAMRDRYQPGTNIVGWLVTIARGLHVNQWRKRKRRARMRHLSQTKSLDMVEPASQDGRLLCEDVTERLSKLNPEVVKAFELVVVEGMRYDEAAKVLRTPVGTIRSRVARVRSAVWKVIFLDIEEDAE